MVKHSTTKGEALSHKKAATNTEQVVGLEKLVLGFY